MSENRQMILCPVCDSTLIQIECCRPVEPDDALLERYCPECGHWEEMEVAMVVADMLAEHAAEFATSLEELAGRLEAASELWISR